MHPGGEPKVESPIRELYDNITPEELEQAETNLIGFFTTLHEIDARLQVQEQETRAS